MSRDTSIIEGKEGNPLFFLFNRMWHYSQGNRRTVAIFWSMFFLAQLVELYFDPIIWSKIMNVIQQQGITKASIGHLTDLLLLLFVSLFVFWGIHGPARIMENDNAFHVRLNYRQFLLQGVLTLPLEWHTDHHSGATIDKIEKGTSGLYYFSQDSFVILYAAVQLIGSYVMLVYLSWPAAITVLLMMAASAWLTMRFDRVLVKQYRQLNKSENDISESVFDAVSNIATVIILRVEKLVYRTVMKKVREPLDLYKRNIRLNELKYFLISFCCAVMTIVVLRVYFQQQIGVPQVVLLGTVYLVINYVRNICQLFFSFTNIYRDVLVRRSRVANAEELSRDFTGETIANHVLSPSWRCLSIDDLSFSYRNGEGDLHLDNVSLTIHRGERVAFVGLSGSGKTTLLQTMRGLYKPQRLNLRVDGQSIVSGFDGISRSISLVQQSPEIFATSILNNLTFGADDRDLDEVRRFTDMACVTEVIEGLPRQWDSTLKERGVNLSGGEKQRLALARGLLACQDKDIILLDEPTSSLDATNQMRFYQRLFQEFGDKTIVSTVHQLHLLPLFGRICMFDQGRIVGVGTLDRLLSDCPEFQQLWIDYHKLNREVN